MIAYCIIYCLVHLCWPFLFSSQVRECARGFVRFIPGQQHWKDDSANISTRRRHTLLEGRIISQEIYSLLSLTISWTSHVFPYCSIFPLRVCPTLVTKDIPVDNVELGMCRGMSPYPGNHCQLPEGVGLLL